MDGKAKIQQEPDGAPEKGEAPNVKPRGTFGWQGKRWVKVIQQVDSGGLQNGGHHGLEYTISYQQ